MNIDSISLPNVTDLLLAQNWCSFPTISVYTMNNTSTSRPIRINSLFHRCIDNNVKILCMELYYRTLNNH